MHRQTSAKQAGSCCQHSFSLLLLLHAVSFSFKAWVSSVSFLKRLNTNNTKPRRNSLSAAKNIANNIVASFSFHFSPQPPTTNSRSSSHDRPHKTISRLS